MKIDGIVIGGGPAGMMAALTAASNGQRVMLLERNERLGKKLLITGKGRCNVTNNCTVQDVLLNVPRNGRFLYSALNAMTPDAVMDFFEKNGCPLKVERGNRVFPVTDRSSSVLESLKKCLKESGVIIRNARASEILVSDGVVSGVACSGERYDCKWVILATGGVSYPATGSTGDGYAMAQMLGHSIIAQDGSLVPLEAEGDICGAMQGLSLRNVSVKLVDGKGKLLFKDFGEFLFTHFGVSGPTVLSASAHLKGNGCCLYVDLKPALDHAKLDARILRDLEKFQNRTMENALVELLPRSMIPVVLKMLNIPLNLQANSLKKEQRRALTELLKAFPVKITGKRPVEEAIITSGGVKVSEIDPKTMGSKLVRRLYFAGEIIDCDAYTGGFNLQIAWSTGFAAGTAVKNID